jgi:hypothetical protein
LASPTPRITIPIPTEQFESIVNISLRKSKGGEATAVEVVAAAAEPTGRETNKDRNGVTLETKIAQHPAIKGAEKI